MGLATPERDGSGILQWGIDPSPPLLIERRQGRRYPASAEVSSEGEGPMALARYAENGLFSLGKIADAFRTTREEVARTAGLGKDESQQQERLRSDKTQRRLREMIEIVNKAEPRFGSALIAYAWYRSEPLSGFSGLTAMHLVRDGRASKVLDLIDEVDAGAHA